MSARRATIAAAAFIAVAAGSALAQSGGGYDLTWNTVDAGGATFSTGGGFTLGATAGQPDAGSHSGGGYSHPSGFWQVAGSVFTVAKDWSDNNASAVTVTLTCDSGVVTPASAPASEGSPAVFSVTGFLGAPSCTATEVVPPGYTANQTGCANVPLATGSCLLLNTLNLATFSVAKDFSDNNPAAVTMTLTCSSGVVTPASAPASEGSPALFSVSGFDGAPTCTATETVPPGYTANQAACANVALATGTCLIANALNGGSFIVTKDFSDDSPAAVAVTLTCDSGVVAPASALSSEVSPAVFTVTGWSGTPLCTATELVPAGYTADQSGCAGVALSAGTCGLVNTAIPGTLTIELATVPTPDLTATAFAFSAGGGLVPSAFVLLDGGTFVFAGVAAGSGYSITPTVPPGWTLTGASCSDGSAPEAIEIGLDEDVTCGFEMTLIQPVVEIPALQTVGLLALLLGLSAAGVALLRRRAG